MSEESSQYLFTSEDDLSVRSQNVIKQLGGIPSLLEHYEKHHTFLDVRNSGVNTDKELTSFCAYLNSLDEEVPFIKEDSLDIDETKIDFESLSAYYLRSKEFLSARTINALKNLEVELDFHISAEHRVIFFKKYFLNNFNYKDVKNVGAKSSKELDKLKDNLITYIRERATGSTLPNRTLLIKQLDKLFEPEMVESLVHDDKYHFQKALCVLLKRAPLTYKKNLIFNCYFFENESYTLQEIADIVGCTRELVRIHIKSLEDEFIPSQVNILKSKVNALPYDIQDYIGQSYLDFPNIEPFEFNGAWFAPNSNLTKLVFQLLLKDKFVLIDDILSDLHTENKSFDLDQLNVFINKEFLAKAQLVKLFQFLNGEIYNFESIGFEYDLRILIERFYRENDYTNLNRDEIDKLDSLIRRIRKKELQIDPVDLKRIAKREQNDRILTIVEELLRERPLKTQEILSAINSNGFDLDITQLLHKLGKHKSTFVRLGNSVWGLTKLQQVDNLRGSLREIVEDILLKRSDPIHISELIGIIEKMRPISVESLNSNLRASESKMFIFFHCSFIGLSAKKYDQYWHEIPRFVPSYLKKEQLLLGPTVNDVDLAEHMQSLYGYPKVHLEYLLLNRSKTHGRHEDNLLN